MFDISSPPLPSLPKKIIIITALTIPYFSPKTRGFSTRGKKEGERENLVKWGWVKRKGGHVGGRSRREERMEEGDERNKKEREREREREKKKFIR